MFVHKHDNEIERKTAVFPPSFPSLKNHSEYIPPTNEFPLQFKRNRLPDRLKASIEALSGIPMDDVQVHYNSLKPAQLQANITHQTPSKKKTFDTEDYSSELQLSVSASKIIQKMDDDEERKRRRADRFSKELNIQQAERQAQRAEIQYLRQMVTVLRQAIGAGQINVDAAGAASKHGDRNPVQTFLNAINSAWNQTECEHRVDESGNQLFVTFRLGRGQTVTAVYTRYSNTCTVIHSGPTASGVGYGTLLE